MTRRSTAFDLHVLGPPPAFVLSQDQTLRQNLGCRLPKQAPASKSVVPVLPKGRTGTSLTSDRDRGPIRMASGQGPSTRQMTARRPCPFAYELSGSDQWRLVIAGGQPALAFIVLYSVFKDHLAAVGHLAHALPPREGVCTLDTARWGPNGTSPGRRLTTLRPGDLTVKGAARLATLAVPEDAPNP